MREDKKKQYIVNEGDDIFSIARETYNGDVRKAFEIMELNSGVRKLYVGLVLDLPE